MRPHPDNTSEATGIKRSNFHFDDQTGSLQTMPSCKLTQSNFPLHRWHRTWNIFVGGIALGDASTLAPIPVLFRLAAPIYSTNLRHHR